LFETLFILRRNERHIAHLRQECHNSKFGIFELLVEKETFADALLTGHTAVWKTRRLRAVVSSLNS